MKLLPIAYIHDPNTNTFVVFKQVDKTDYTIAEFQHEGMVRQWLDDNFIKVEETTDYSICKPTRYLNK